MKLAYVDTSCLVAIAFAEPGHKALARRLEDIDRLFAANLLEAEFRSALQREAMDRDPEALLSRITWVFPERSLRAEFEQVLAHGHVCGADLWHLACALYLRRAVGDLGFSTLDDLQQEVAEALGLG